MTDKRDLQALIERVEKATGPDRDLDADIYEALGYEVKRRSERVEEGWRVRRTVDWRYLDGSSWLAMDYLTGSVDAALALVERVLPGAAYTINSFDVQRTPTTERRVHVHLSDYEGADHGALGDAPTAPLAILIATLRARRMSR